MQEYLTKHKLKTKEDIAQHIVELKRNTFPDLGLISSLCSYLFDGEKTNRLHCIPIDATNIEVFHLDTKDNGDRTAFIGFKISNGNFSFVEVPFTSQNPAEKTEKQHYTQTMSIDSDIDKEWVVKESKEGEFTLTNVPKQGVLNDHVKEIIEKGASTRHKSQNGETHKEVGENSGFTEHEKKMWDMLNPELEVNKEPLNYSSKKETRIENLIKDGKNCRNGNVCFCDGSCKKQELFTRTVTPFFLDEVLEAPLGSFGRRGRVINYSTRHKAREEGNFHKDDVITSSNRGEKETIEYLQGVKHNQLKPRLDVVINTQFPKALQLIALATEYGNSKYKETDLDMLNFKRVAGGSQTYFDSCARHSTDRNGLDESGLPHIIHAVWSSLAGLELWAEENKINVKEFTENYMKNLQD